MLLPCGPSGAFRRKLNLPSTPATCTADSWYKFQVSSSACGPCPIRASKTWKPLTRRNNRPGPTIPLRTAVPRIESVRESLHERTPSSREADASDSLKQRRIKVNAQHNMRWHNMKDKTQGITGKSGTRCPKLRTA